MSTTPDWLVTPACVSDISFLHIIHDNNKKIIIITSIFVVVITTISRKNNFNNNKNENGYFNYIIE